MHFCYDLFNFQPNIDTHVRFWPHFYAVYFCLFALRIFFFYSLSKSIFNNYSNSKWQWATKFGSQIFRYEARSVSSTAILIRNFQHVVNETYIIGMIKIHTVHRRRILAFGTYLFCIVQSINACVDVVYMHCDSLLFCLCECIFVRVMMFVFDSI